MHTLTKSPWSKYRKALCAAGLAAMASGALADEVAPEVARDITVASKMAATRLDDTAPRQIKSRKASSWLTPKLPMSWNRTDEPVARYTDDGYLRAMDNFDTGSLFRTRKELLYQDTLRMLLTKRQLRVWIRDNLHVQCELKRWHTVDDGREMGFKVGVYYRFD